VLLTVKNLDNGVSACLIQPLLPRPSSRLHSRLHMIR
jgi:hypothetical protein